jgi:hypothetical protein
VAEDFHVIPLVPEPERDAHRRFGKQAHWRSQVYGLYGEEMQLHRPQGKWTMPVRRHVQGPEIVICTRSLVRWQTRFISGTLNKASRRGWWPLSGYQEFDGERSSLWLLCQTHFWHLAKSRSCIISLGMQRQRDIIKCNILWKGNPILVIKTFGKCTFVLCAQQREDEDRQTLPKDPRTTYQFLF